MPTMDTVKSQLVSVKSNTKGDLVVTLDVAVENNGEECGVGVGAAKHDSPSSSQTNGDPDERCEVTFHADDPGEGLELSRMV